jgi:hypothetical protein
MRNRRVWLALVFSIALLLGRGAVAIAYAEACWNAAYNDPTRVDISDITDLYSKSVTYTDPMDDVRRALLVVMPPTGRVVLASTPSLDAGSPRAHRPRAPPAA